VSLEKASVLEIAADLRCGVWARKTGHSRSVMDTNTFCASDKGAGGLDECRFAKGLLRAS
jgi:hypothetical protein